MCYDWTTILREVKLLIVNSAIESQLCCMYTLFPNTDTKAVCALENGPGIPICKKIKFKNGKKIKKKKKKKKRSGQPV